MKSVLISIQPKWVEKIASGEKTIEVRKTKPNLATPFKCYIYETKDKKYKDIGILGYKKDGTPYNFVNCIGKVIGEFVCDRIDEYLCEEYEWEDGQNSLEYRIRSVEGRKTCLDYDEVREYGNEKPIYFWYINDLKIYDKPKELSEFYSYKECSFKDWGDVDNIGCWEGVCESFDRGECKYGNLQLQRPPQSWCYIEDYYNEDLGE